MKFKFNKNLDYQLEAINSIVDIFDIGENFAKQNNVFELQAFEKYIANELKIDEKRFLENIKNIQKINKIEESVGLDKMDFSIEMETGTGKTYVYLRTIFELNKKYNLKKFIILVPSVAIREGVLKTLEQTKQHFKELYNTNYGYFAYDSKKLSKVREFSQSLDLQIMIMTIQAFNKDKNIMRQTPDRFNGDKPIEMVAKTWPVVVMDEPQNMESELSKSAIEDLNALFKLRYSATHKTKHNLMYRLDPFDAYKKGLVKRIEVFGIKEDNSQAMVFSIKEIKIQKEKAPTAIVNLEFKQPNGEYSIRKMLVKSGDVLKDRTNNEKYEELFVREVSARNNEIELSDGNFYKLEQELVENKEQIFRTQIKETIKSHLDKQIELGDKIKVLSLFFIDKVDNYVGENALIKKIFEEEFEKLKLKSDLFANIETWKVHNGYFAKKKEKGVEIYKNTTGKTKADKEVYDLIMKNKEKLLSFVEPTSFIFSHSALREGWDNPNIFQICTLNETKSQSKKRQEIGRGLRLAVDINGDRVFDPNINILTVVANESYKEFVGNLQSEYIEDGYKTPQVSNKKGKITVKFKKQIVLENEDFKKLWEKIRKKTKYKLEVDKESLVEKVIKEINDKLKTNNLVVRISKVIVDFKEGGKINTIIENESVGESLNINKRIYNFVSRIAKETGLTKNTIFEIFSKIDNLELIFRNPEEFVRSAILIINGAKNDLLINEGLKYFPIDNVWELSLFEDWDTYKNKTLDSDKTAYEKVVFDSDGEKEFAQNLDLSPRIKFFIKLPRTFVVDTPLGTYNPDWAIVKQTENGDKLYLVRETKFVTDLENLRQSETRKIVCGKKHFDTIGVDFKDIKERDLSDL